MKKLLTRFILLLILASGIAAGFFYYQSLNPNPAQQNIKIPSFTTPNINISIPSMTIKPSTASTASGSGK